MGSDENVGDQVNMLGALNQLKFHCYTLSFTLFPALAFESYQGNIPNGDQVPHPCKPNYLWHGVGHKFAHGRRDLNFFGKDFTSSNHQWTKALCEKDSDGDGMTNGEELGDPDCIWSPGKYPSRTANITHPGVCEPWNDPKCQEQLSWLESECQRQEFLCDALNETGILNMTVQFPKTSVPSSETTYICIVFDLPNDEDYHLVATRPIIDNTHIMHHAVLFGCEDDATLEPRPSPCDMVPSPKCKEVISIWAVGMSGDCIHDSTGFRIGTKGYKRAALQFHWNNPGLHSNYFDQSALILYYTINRRITDAGILTVGASYLNIEPRTERVEYTGICPAECTNLVVKDKVYIASATNHMHYLGLSQQIEQFRNGSRVRYITKEVNYNYDNPHVFKFPEPLELLPGDTITTTCMFSSTERSEITKFGYSTSDEMCFGFLTYYPKQHITLSECSSWKSVPSCVINKRLTYKGCNLYNFLRLRNFEFILLFQKFGKVCDSSCSSDCLDVVRALGTIPCLQGDFRDYIVDITKNVQQFQAFFAALEVCSLNINVDALTSTAAKAFTFSLLWLTNSLFITYIIKDIFCDLLVVN